MLSSSSRVGSTSISSRSSRICSCSSNGISFTAAFAIVVVSCYVSTDGSSESVRAVAVV